MHIVPLIAGEERAALRFCQQALELGVFAQAIRPPTVPDGTSRLRLTTMASHTPGELGDAARALAIAARRAGLEPEALPAPPPEPVDELAEIETALVRAERLAAVPEPGDVPFDAERAAGVPFDQHAGARPGGARSRPPGRRSRSSSRSSRPRAARPPSCSTSNARPDRGARLARPVRHGNRHGSRQDGAERLLARGDARRRRGRTGLQAGADRDERSPPRGAWPADDVLLADAAGMRPEEVTALRYGPAVSPHLAAELAGEPIDPGELLARVRAMLSGAGTVVVEGVGGLLVPIAGAWTVRDLAAGLGLPLVVAAAPGLGTISHTLLTLEAARAAGLDVRAVVLTPWPGQPDAIERSNRETIARLGDVEVSALPLLSGPETAELARAGATLPWRDWLDPPSAA